MIRPLSPIDKIHLDAMVAVQFAMRVKDSSSIDPLVKKLNKLVVGFHSHIENNSIVTTNADVKTPVFHLPDFKSLADACTYMVNNHHLPYDQALASLGVNKDSIVLNINHIAADGGLIMQLYDTLKNETDVSINDYRIEDQDKVFSKEIKEATNIPPFVGAGPNLTRIHPKDKIGLSLDEKCHYLINKSKANDLQIFNKKTNKLSGLSDSLWSNLILSVSAFNNDFSSQGCSTCVNLRPFMKHSPTFCDTNNFSNLTLSSHATKDTTVLEMMKQIRADFNMRMKSGELFGYLKGMQMSSEAKPIPGIGIQLSNVGRFKLGGPFVDLFLNCTMSSYVTPNNTYVTTYSIEGPKRNDIITSTRYTSSVISDKDMQIITKSIHYGMENIPLNITCGEALERLKDYQYSLEKELDKNRKIASSLE